MRSGYAGSGWRWEKEGDSKSDGYGEGEGGEIDFRGRGGEGRGREGEGGRRLVTDIEQEETKREKVAMKRRYMRRGRGGDTEKEEIGERIENRGETTPDSR